MERFTTTVAAGPRGHLVIPVPFDPDTVWGRKPRHLVGGTVDGIRVRGEVATAGTEAGARLLVGPAWLRDCGMAAGDTVTVELFPEGPQRADLADDLAAALAADPAAGAFFDSLAQFYRRAYLRYIDATKRHPEQRPARIAEVVALLAAGTKERPKP
ncbi:YdeI/OmpD-associated family protein [Dactylosporangium sp. AC04546]|uniref:YdeI/OmpD-associated family protein n=1 Tax=Dactylosporangium sp. AC04546 TaxID=2862460 RepID=UPI001EDE8902|nr:YdeI/OmpD-associated family protein [Dactylosporangium sp. AC04546]WVK81349.1 YdeI/OmpD-associated family protein [Dactylosporangium sp. AC04546]